MGPSCLEKEDWESWPRGRPRKTWLEVVKNDMSGKCALDRHAWREEDWVYIYSFYSNTRHNAYVDNKEAVLINE